MRQQLIQYVELLFAGAPDSEEIKMEILQNTLDRYDDLVSQGKSPEAAYRLAITGIGDVNEILGNTYTQTTQKPMYQAPASEPDTDTPVKKLLRACAVGLYILCPVPLFVLSELGMDTLGLCGTLALVAVATVLIILGKKKETLEARNAEIPLTSRQKLSSSVSSLIWAIAMAVYFIVSFLTQAWYITWIIVLIAKCVICLARAIMDLREAVEYEN